MENKQFNHAENELKILNETVNESLLKPFENEILSLVNRVLDSDLLYRANAGYYAQAISQACKKLIMYESLTPLTGEDSEWDNNSSEEQTPNLDEDKFLSNIRHRGLIKRSDGECVLLEGGITFRHIESPNLTFTGYGVYLDDDKKEKIGSSIENIVFPLFPKHFTIDVKKVYVDPTNPESEYDLIVVDKKQYEEAIQYYSKPYEEC